MNSRVFKKFGSDHVLIVIFEKCDILWLFYDIFELAGMHVCFFTDNFKNAGKKHVRYHIF